MKTTSFRVEEIRRKWISISFALVNDQEQRFEGEVLKSDWLRLQPNSRYTLVIHDKPIPRKFSSRLVFTPDGFEEKGSQLEVYTSVAILKEISGGNILNSKGEQQLLDQSQPDVFEYQTLERGGSK